MAASGPLDTFHTDQVGSLLRPQDLKDAFARLGQDDTSTDELRAAEDAAIRSAVALQDAHGVAVLTDGEFRRLNFQDSFAASVGGYDAPSPFSVDFHVNRTQGGTPGQRWDPGYTGHGPAVVHRRPTRARIQLVRNLPLEEYRFTASITSRPVKVTLVGPDRVTQRFDFEASRAVYPEVDAFVHDLVQVERQMVQELVDAGCPYVQIDEPGYTAYVDEPSLAQMRERGEDPQANMRRSIAANNAIIADFPGTTFGVHLCRGNQAGMWHREGAYDAIAEELFTGLAHQRLLLEYDTERAGSFAPLRFVPRDKVVVLGLVSTKTPRLETADDLKQRIDEATRYLPLEQLALSPQCGFASDVVGNPLTADDQWRKLEVIHAVAMDVWGSA